MTDADRLREFEALAACAARALDPETTLKRKISLAARRHEKHEIVTALANLSCQTSTQPLLAEQD